MGLNDQNRANRKVHAYNVVMPALSRYSKSAKTISIRKFLMSGTYESLKLNSEDSNVERLGTFIAWLVANNLLSSALENSAGSSVARLRMQDLTGAEFLTTVMHGEFKVEHLTENARKFVDEYFVSDSYESDFNAAVTAIKYDATQDAFNNAWLLYDEVAPRISTA